MYPLVRLCRVTLAALFSRRRLGPLGESILHFRVWPGDLDFNLHMNDGRFVTLMNLGRVDLILRSRVHKGVQGERWAPINAATYIRFRRELRLFQRFRMRSRIVGWDEKWFFLEQTIEVGGAMAASALLRTTLKGESGPIPPAKIVASLGLDPESPPLPETILSLRRHERDSAAAAPPH